jgi:hypothetical protein
LGFTPVEGSEKSPPFVRVFGRAAADLFTRPWAKSKDGWNRRGEGWTPDKWALSHESHYDADFRERTGMLAVGPHGERANLARTCDPMEAPGLSRERVEALYTDGGLIDRAMRRLGPFALSGSSEVPGELASELKVLSVDGPKITLMYREPGTGRAVVYRPLEEVAEEGGRGRKFQVEVHEGLAPGNDGDPGEAHAAGVIRGQTLIAYAPAPTDWRALAGEIASELSGRATFQRAAAAAGNLIATVERPKSRAREALLAKAVDAVPGGAGSMAIETFIRGHPGRKVKYLVTSSVLESDLPYESAPRPEKPFKEMTSLDEAPRVEVELPTEIVFLTGEVEQGSASHVRLGFLKDGRPVAIKAHLPVELWKGKEQERLRIEANGARLLDDLGIGPRFHGIFAEGDGTLNVVTDIVPGDFPTEASKDITLQTIEDLEEASHRLARTGRDLGGDVQGPVTPRGRLLFIDPWAVGHGPSLRGKQETYHEKRIAEMIELAPPAVQEAYIRKTGGRALVFLESEQLLTSTVRRDGEVKETLKVFWDAHRPSERGTVEFRVGKSVLRIDPVKKTASAVDPQGRETGPVALEPGKELVFGRSEEAGLVIRDPMISGRHGRIQWRAVGVAVMDGVAGKEPANRTKALERGFFFLEKTVEETPIPRALDVRTERVPIRPSEALLRELLLNGRAQPVRFDMTVAPREHAPVDQWRYFVELHGGTSGERAEGFPAVDTEAGFRNAYERGRRDYRFRQTLRAEIFRLLTPGKGARGWEQALALTGLLHASGGTLRPGFPATDGALQWDLDVLLQAPFHEGFPMEAERLDAAFDRHYDGARRAAARLMDRDEVLKASKKTENKILLFDVRDPSKMAEAARLASGGETPAGRLALVVDQDTALPEELKRLNPVLKTVEKGKKFKPAAWTKEKFFENRPMDIFVFSEDAVDQDGLPADARVLVLLGDLVKDATASLGKELERLRFTRIQA